MNVEDYRRKEPATVSIGATFHDVEEKRVDADRSMVLVKSGPDIVGIVTDTDIFAHATAGNDLGAIKVRRCMSACEFWGVNPCLQVFEDSPLEEAIRTMAMSGTHNLFVWGKDGHMRGVISANDILKTVN